MVNSFKEGDLCWCFDEIVKFIQVSEDPDFALVRFVSNDGTGIVHMSNLKRIEKNDKNIIFNKKGSFIKRLPYMIGYLCGIVLTSCVLALIIAGTISLVKLLLN